MGQHFPPKLVSIIVFHLNRRFRITVMKIVAVAASVVEQAIGDEVAGGRPVNKLPLYM